MLTTRGFTIVELLIVIVVIAILASVSTSSFRGIQDRATNAVVLSDARKFKSVLEQYVAYNSIESLRAFLSSSAQCLGQNYVDLDEGAGVACDIYTDQYGSSYSRSNSSLDAALMQFSDYSVSKSSVVQYGVDDGAGPGYDWQEKSSAPFIRTITNNNYLVDGRAGAVYMTYTLKGPNLDCILRPVISYSHFAGGINYSTTTSGATYSGGVPNGTYCSILISG